MIIFAPYDEMPVHDPEVLGPIFFKAMKGYSYKLITFTSFALASSALLLGISSIDDGKASSFGIPSFIYILHVFLLIVIALTFLVYRKAFVSSNGTHVDKHPLPDLFWNMPAAMFLVSLKDGRVMDYNKSFLQLLDLRAWEVTGKALQDLGVCYSGLDKTDFMDEVNLPRNTPLEITFRTHHGHILFVSVTTQTVTVNHMSCILCVLSDMSDRKLAEDRLHESEERYSLMMKRLKEYAMLTLDPQGYVINWNDSAVTLTGYVSREVVGKHFSFFYASEQPNDNLSVCALDFTKLVDEHTTGEVWLSRKDGSRFCSDVMINKAFDNNGNERGFICIIKDKTEHNTVKAKLTDVQEKERELNEMRSGFVTTASHEFRTPLTTIMSSAFLLENYTRPEDQQNREKHFARIRSSVRNLISTLDEFLLIEKIDERKTETVIEPVNLKEYIIRFCHEIEGSAKTGQKIYYKHEGREEIETDVVSLHHILHSLISNAVKYSSENSRINIVSKVVDGKVTISVKDSGIGISQKDQRHLFERFFRSPAVSSIQGTGLGLHIMKYYVDQLKGSVRVESEVEKGTEFIVEFHEPVANASATTIKSAGTAATDLTLPAPHCAALPVYHVPKLHSVK